MTVKIFRHLESYETLELREHLEQNRHRIVNIVEMHDSLGMKLFDIAHSKITIFTWVNPIMHVSFPTTLRRCPVLNPCKRRKHQNPNPHQHPLV